MQVSNTVTALQMCFEVHILGHTVKGIGITGTT